MATTSYRSAVSGRDGFRPLLLAEWTKLRSVPGWVLTMVAAVVLTVLVAALMAAGNKAVGGGGQPRNPGRLEPRPLSGDGSVVARVTAQDDSHERAMAGLMVRESTRPGSPYAAVVLTPGHGVQLHSSVAGDVAGSAGTAPRWLKLTRSGTSVTAYESADGDSWSRVGTVELGGLPATVEVGPFVASPSAVKVGRELGGETVDEVATVGRATFDGVRLEPQQATGWPRTLTLTGSGDFGPDEFRDDVTATTLSGVLVGLMAIVALAALFITSEYERGTIRTTFAATPRRGRVLAAKAVVIGTVTFAAGLVASFGAFLIADPILRSNGVTPPSLFDGPALRAVVGTAALLAVVAVFSLGVATIVRRSAAAITVVLVLLLVPQIVATGLPLSVAIWLERLTPAAGLAIQQTVHRYDTAIGPWAGFAVLCGYAAIALAGATWQLRGRDA